MSGRTVTVVRTMLEAAQDAWRRAARLRRLGQRWRCRQDAESCAVFHERRAVRFTQRAWELASVSPSPHCFSPPRPAPHARQTPAAPVV